MFFVNAAKNNTAIASVFCSARITKFMIFCCKEAFLLLGQIFSKSEAKTVVKQKEKRKKRNSNQIGNLLFVRRLVKGLAKQFKVRGKKTRNTEK